MTATVLLVLAAVAFALVAIGANVPHVNLTGAGLFFAALAALAIRLNLP